MGEILKYLNEFGQKYDKDIAIDYIVESFDLNLKEGIEIYKSWRSEFIKSKIPVEKLIEEDIAKAEKNRLNAKKDFETVEEYAEYAANLIWTKSSKEEIIKVLNLRFSGVKKRKEIEKVTGIEKNKINSILSSATNRGFLKLKDREIL